MTMLGLGAVVILGDLGTDERSAHDHWHSHEHLPERVGIPGFLRGRRAVAVEAGAPQIMALYEVDNLATLTSPAYLARLDDPTPWSREIMGSVKQLSRTLCRVSASHGSGVGAQALTIAFALPPERAPAMRAWLAELLPTVVGEAGLTGAHLLEREASAEPPLTQEQRVRGKRDVEVDAVLLIEGYDEQALTELLTTTLAPARLVEHGAGAAPQTRFWRLAHVMVPADMQRR